MTSYRQLNANRKNAKKSTGPTTTRGKSVSRLNAVKHGLSSRSGAGENADVYREHLGEMLCEFRPATQLSWYLVRQVADICWQLARVPLFEAGIWNCRIGEVDPTIGSLSRSKVPARFKALGSAEQDASIEWCRETLLWGVMFLREAEKGDALNKLSRYHTSLLNRLQKTLALLEQSGCPINPYRASS